MTITQGKWEVEEYRGLFTVTTDDEPICVFYLLQEEDHHYQEFENAEANAILIAEAPETKRQRDELQEENKQLKKDLAHEIDMNAQGRAKKLDIDDLIDNFISDLDFDHIIAWAKLFDIEINPPPVDDMYPNWQNELAVEVGDAMRKVGEK